MKTYFLTYGLLLLVSIAIADEPATGPSGTVCESPGGSCKGRPDGALIPYEGDCNKFIQCFMNCGCDKQCPSGLHFNAKLQVCDWPTSAGCDNSCSGCVTTPEPECEWPVGDLCKNIKDGTSVSYPNDCTKYIVCSKQCGTVKDCPNGTHFCSQLQQCTLPSLAGCDPSYGTTTPAPSCPECECDSVGGKC